VVATTTKSRRTRRPSAAVSKRGGETRRGDGSGYPTRRLSGAQRTFFTLSNGHSVPAGGDARNAFELPSTVRSVRRDGRVSHCPAPTPNFLLSKSDLRPGNAACLIHFSRVATPIRAWTVPDRTRSARLEAADGVFLTHCLLIGYENRAQVVFGGFYVFSERLRHRFRPNNR